jgi:hypothetical protein
MDPLYNHQQEAVTRLGRNNNFALIMEQGTGKSRPVIEDWLNRIVIEKAQDLVVIAPKGCYMNWIGTEDDPGELDKWMPPEARAEITAVPWISGGTKAQRYALDKLLHVKGPRFLAMNVEALNREGAAREYLLKFTDGRLVIGCVDESTTIAREEAARTKFILNTLAHRFVARRILTGLVAPEGPLGLYTQYAFLDWRIIGQRSFWAFKNRFAVTQQMDFRPLAKRIKDLEVKRKHRLATVVVEFRNLPELHERIMKNSYRVTKEEVLDLPPKIFKFWDVDLTDEQASAYTQMKEVAAARLMNGEYSTASMKLDQLGKMQHILCGHVRAESGELADIPENRTGAVVEILREHSGKAIIWAPYPQALRKIRIKLQEEFGPDSTVSFWGETTLDERLEARDRIQTDDACRFIVSNQSVGKFGNTWTACNLVIYYANSFDLEDRLQSEDRAHRIGQTKFVTYIDLRATGTLDDHLIKTLRKKLNVVSTLQGDGFKEWLI